MQVHRLQLEEGWLHAVAAVAQTQAFQLGEAGEVALLVVNNCRLLQKS
eukprot:COSAG02_NODE_7930_length_2781_cov_2.454884_3_plen_48_part_00